MYRMAKQMNLVYILVYKILKISNDLIFTTARCIILTDYLFGLHGRNHSYLSWKLLYHHKLKGELKQTDISFYRINIVFIRLFIFVSEWPKKGADLNSTPCTYTDVFKGTLKLRHPRKRCFGDNSLIYKGDENVTMGQQPFKCMYS